MDRYDVAELRTFTVIRLNSVHLVAIGFQLRLLLYTLTCMEYPSDSSSDSESDHEDVQDNTGELDYPELSLVDDLRTSLTITERGG